MKYFASLTCIVSGTFLFCLGYLQSTFAQIIPDNTLGNESTQVTSGVEVMGIRSDRIDNGTKRGINLFHSFREFSLGEGQSVYFGNPPEIKNILARVTGKNISNILGALGVDGTANLFLINPNGILFGPNAQLNVRGSFTATTANAIQFGNLGSYSATNPGAPSPLLTVNPSAFLFNQVTASAISVNASTLLVPEGQSLFLLGGDINLNAARLLASGGRIELGGVAGTGTVEFSVDGSSLQAKFPDEVARSNTSLTNGTEVYVAAGRGGSIAINTQNLNILRGSSLFAGIEVFTGSVGVQAGDITINATGTVAVHSGQISNAGDPLGGVGKGGSIFIKASSIELGNDANLTTSTSNKENAGTILLQARNSISLAGESSIFSNTYGSGGAGSIWLSARSIALTDGFNLNASSYGRGNAGSITVRASDSVALSSKSFISAVAGSEGTLVGSAGSITIQAKTVSLTGGSRLFTSTSGEGGAAGKISIHAQDSVSLANSAIFSNTSGRGKGGDINIETGVFSANGPEARVSVSSTGSGNAGDITITAASVRLDNQGSLGAIAQSRNGGDITLQLRDLLLMRHGSEISTSAGTAQLGGDGGNIKINAPFIVSAPFENSDITTNAFSGSGGKVRINTQGLFWIAPLSRTELEQRLGTTDPAKLDPRLLLTNDITAISQANPFLDGVITINTLDIDPSRGLTPLPTNLVDPSQLIAQGCSPRGPQVASSFVATGRGGLPSSPTDPLTNEAISAGWVTIDESIEQRNEVSEQRDKGRTDFHPSRILASNARRATEIIEAQGWVRDAKGDVYLVAASSAVAPHNSAIASPICSQK